MNCGTTKLIKHLSSMAQIGPTPIGILKEYRETVNWETFDFVFELF